VGGGGVGKSELRCERDDGYASVWGGGLVVMEKGKVGELED